MSSDVPGRLELQMRRGVILLFNALLHIVPLQR